MFQQWGDIDNGNGNNAQIEDFLEQLEKFVNNLMAALSNMEGQITLEENGIGAIIDGIETPADYQAVGKCLKHRVGFHKTCLELSLVRTFSYLKNNISIDRGNNDPSQEIILFSNVSPMFFIQ